LHLCCLAGLLLASSAFSENPASAEASAPATAEPIDPNNPPYKLAISSDKCHARGTQSYKQTLHFRPFANLTDCEAARRAKAPTTEQPADRPTRTRGRDIEVVDNEPSAIDWRSLLTWLLPLIGITGLASASHWMKQRRTRRKLAEFEKQNERRWRGHRLDRPK
jgi:uncharacterized protein YjiS (DUF1127 family)